MATAGKPVPRIAGKSTRPNGDVGEIVRTIRALVDPYRPEQHYMRGPGPKWHAKHTRAAADSPADSALIPAKG